jgi:hypothetical protein
MDVARYYEFAGAARNQAGIGGGRSKSEKFVSEARPAGPAVAWTRTTGRTGAPSNRGAAGRAAAVPRTAGVCAQPPRHWGAAVQAGPWWPAFRFALRQQHSFDLTQHDIPQVGLSPRGRSRKEEP